jgi:hypothetical protein
LVIAAVIAYSSNLEGRFKKIVYGQTFVFIFVSLTRGIELQENIVKKKIHRCEWN